MTIQEQRDFFTAKLEEVKKVEIMWGVLNSKMMKLEQDLSFALMAINKMNEQAQPEWAELSEADFPF
jgi:hypothetical protein